MVGLAYGWCSLVEDKSRRAERRILNRRRKASGRKKHICTNFEEFPDSATFCEVAFRESGACSWMNRVMRRSSTT